MLSSRYKHVFFIKIILGIIGIMFVMFAIVQKNQVNSPMVVFVIDMHESMDTQDVSDTIWLSRSRKQAALQYVYETVEDFDDDVAVGMIRLGYYPDYILPPTHDRDHIASYATSLSAGPSADVISYQTGDISLSDYYSYNPQAKYILISDKESTINNSKQHIPGLKTVRIGNGIANADIRSRDDLNQVKTIGYHQSSYLSWIFGLIILVSLLLL